MFKSARPDIGSNPGVGVEAKFEAKAIIRFLLGRESTLVQLVVLVLTDMTVYDLSSI